MKLLVMKFRVNDLDSSYGKQIEFNAGIVKEFFGFTNDSENIEFVYKSLKGDAVNDNTSIKALLEKSPARGDYKIYTNTDGSLFLKQFFLEKLGLNLKDNGEDFFTIKRLGNNKYEVSYIPVDSELGQYFSAQSLAGQIIDIADETVNAEKIDKPHNRIIFGAPGTGKSHKLNDDAKKYFKIFLADISNLEKNNSRKTDFVRNYKLENHIKNYINQPNDKYVYETKAGMKYAQYINGLRESGVRGKEFDNIFGITHNNCYLQYASKAMLIGEEKTQTCYERVTFHPNYSYAQFVGTYKPVQDSADENQIKYEYVPGPFMRVYLAAKQNSAQNFLLLIEEINRANVAAVFGDVFQLLDRDENGNSEYPIAASEDIKKYLAKNGIHEDELRIPSNMYIWATMNSADQGVFPIDTAFKRRWEFEYIWIDDNEKEVEHYEIPISEKKKVNWNELRKAINDKLILLGVNEDKLLGPFFLSKSVLESAMEKRADFITLFESKVLMYLFEDAAKMKVRQLFKLDSEKYIYSEVCKKFEKDGLDVFKFEEKSVIVQDIESKQSAISDIGEDSADE